MMAENESVADSIQSIVSNDFQNLIDAFKKCFSVVHSQSSRQNSTIDCKLKYN